MPRLLLVIDEFAMLAKDYPDVLKSLVSVAAVGRTLGVHMILATQRPAGVVNEDILANTNLRVALRVQSRDDSINVIGVPGGRGDRPDPDGAARTSSSARTTSPRCRPRWSPAAPRRRPRTLVDAAPGRSSATTSSRGSRRGRSRRRRRPTSTCSSTRSSRPTHELGYAAPRPVWPEPLGDARGADRRRRAGRPSGRRRSVGRVAWVARRVRRRRRPRPASASCRSAGTWTAATCCSSASPAAARARRWPRSR